MLSCVDIYKPHYIVSADLGILNYTKIPKLTGTTYTVTPKQMEQCKLPMKWLFKMANSVMGINGKLLEYRHLIANQTTRATWQHSYGNKIVCLAQGMPGCNTGTNIIVFIKKNQVTQNRAKDLTYGLIICLIRPEKIEERNQKRLVVGGDRVHFPGNAGTPSANLLTVKLLINSTISTPNAKYMTMDIKDFYLKTPPWPDTNTCNYKLLTCPKMSSSTTISQTLQHRTDRSTERFKRECTAYHRPESFPETTTTTWIPPKQDNTRPVETLHTTNFLHPSCR